MCLLERSQIYWWRRESKGMDSVTFVSRIQGLHILHGVGRKCLFYVLSPKIVFKTKISFPWKPKFYAIFAKLFPSHKLQYCSFSLWALLNCWFKGGGVDSLQKRRLATAVCWRCCSGGHKWEIWFGEAVVALGRPAERGLPLLCSGSRNEFLKTQGNRGTEKSVFSDKLCVVFTMLC